MVQLGYQKYGNRPLTGSSSHSDSSHLSYSSRRLGIPDYPRDGHALPQLHFGVASELCIDSTTIATFYTAPVSPIYHRRTHAREKAGLERTQEFAKTGSEYSHIHKTRPHTPGFALTDSPFGLLAWIYEKLRDWTDDYPWMDDEILTWISIYVFSGAGPDASIQLYYEIDNPPKPIVGKLSGTMESFMKYHTTPLGLSYFPKDVIMLPSSWEQILGPVVFEKRHVEGGHFAAWEKPEEVAEDVREMVRKAGIGVARRAES